MTSTALELRAFKAGDLEAVVSVWLAAGKAEYTYLPLFQALDAVSATNVFTAHILPQCELTLACADAQVVAFLALDDDLIDRLYVAPGAQGLGVGSLLVDYAKSECPDGLRLYTHQANERARAFYIGHGFRAVRFGVSPAPELEPDVEYRWQKRG